MKAKEEVEPGAVLFQIDTQPYQLEVDRLETKLVDATQAVKETNAALEKAKAPVALVVADRARVKTAFGRATKADAEVLPHSEIDNRRQLYLANGAALEAARADLRQIKRSLGAQVGGIETRVLEIEDRLEKARLDPPPRTTARAPNHGKLLPERRGRARPGSRGRRDPRCGAGAHFPGQGEGRHRGDPEADLPPTGGLISGDLLEHHDRLLALIDLEKDLNEYGLPIGVQGQAAIYADRNALYSSPVRRILLRMMGWLDCLDPIKS